MTFIFTLIFHTKALWYTFNAKIMLVTLRIIMKYKSDFTTYETNLQFALNYKYNLCWWINFYLWLDEGLVFGCYFEHFIKMLWEGNNSFGFDISAREIISNELMCQFVYERHSIMWPWCDQEKHAKQLSEYIHCCRHTARVNRLPCKWEREKCNKVKVKCVCPIDDEIASSMREWNDMEYTEDGGYQMICAALVEFLCTFQNQFMIFFSAEFCQQIISMAPFLTAHMNQNSMNEFYS